MKQRMPEWTGGRRLCAAAIGICLITLAGSCRTATVSDDTMPKRDIKTVMESHVDELMAIPGVTGVAIGALDDGTPCIQVLVEKKTEDVIRHIPKTLEGHPVTIIESGVIRPMGGT